MVPNANSEPAPTPRIVAAATEVFQSLGWAVGTGSAEVDQRFTSFCQMLARLADDEERDLVLELTTDFLHLSLGSYPVAIEQALGKVLPHLSADRFIVTAPLIAPKDIGKIKSGSMAAYLFRVRFEELARQSGFKIFNGDRPELRPVGKADAQFSPFRPNVVLMDDFLGTGQTASETIQAFSIEYKVPTNLIIVLALVGQQQAVDVIEALGATAVVAHVRNRGISDSVKFKDISKALRTMLAIEERLQVAAMNSLGYGQSEALVSMIRCPNNTFPMYWTTKKVDGAQWPALFVR